jgi:hypothetical protein
MYHPQERADWNIDLQSVHRAGFQPAERQRGLKHLDSRENLSWAHRAKPHVPAAKKRAAFSNW